MGLVRRFLWSHGVRRVRDVLVNHCSQLETWPCCMRLDRPTAEPESPDQRGESLPRGKAPAGATDLGKAGCHSGTSDYLSISGH